MDKLSALQSFIKVVEEGSFAAAARDLGMSRAQINRQVINLEDALGVQLLHRTTRSVTLTQAGDAYYKRCRGLLRDLQEAEHEVQQEHLEPRGELRLNAPQSFGVRQLTPALVEFHKRHPRISVQLSLSDQFVDPLTEGIDLTLRIAARRELPSLITHEIFEIRRALCASPEFLRQHGIPRHPRDLSDLPCLHYGNLPTGNSWRLEQGEESFDVRVNGILCANNADVLNEAAVAGMGIALLPLFIARDDLRAGRLVTLLDDYSAPRIYLSLVYAPSRNMSTKIRLFVKFVQEWFKESEF
jgi:DNA-binding transcriptional LysR family regulator